MSSQIRGEALCGNAERTQELAARLGALLTGGDVIALVGDLGSGKTTFTRGLCRGAGLDDGRLVSSPTYVLEHIYPAPRRVHHYDAYRLASAAEFLALGFEEHIARGEIIVIEWADKVLEVLPASRLLVEIAPAPREEAVEERRIIVSGPRDVWGGRLAILSLEQGATPASGEGLAGGSANRS